MTTYPGIFNDVIGPVMRGPNGSLTTTHKGQGSDMGLFSGFLGWEADDERLPGYLQGLAEAASRRVVTPTVYSWFRCAAIASPAGGMGCTTP
jgi:hypothetical protein